MKHICTAFAENYGKARELSERERDVLDLAMKGRLNKEIADELGIALQTVKNHMRSVFIKLNVENRIELLLLVQKKGDAI